MDETLNSMIYPSNTFGDYALNNTFYVLGVFKTYFGVGKYKNLSLREGFKQMSKPEYPDIKDQTTLKLIELGFSEVRKYIPRARIYKKYIGRGCISKGPDGWVYNLLYV